MAAASSTTADKCEKDMVIFYKNRIYPSNAQPHRRLLPKEPEVKHFKIPFVNKPLIPISESEESLQIIAAFSEEDEEDEIMLPRLPGDSFPTTDHIRLVGSSSSAEFSDEDEEETSDLLRRLQQSQARMEQIKRMLVNQRGFIVESLKQLAENKNQRTNMEPDKVSTSSSYSTKDNAYPKSDIDTILTKTQNGKASFRLCPMCEVPFPQSVEQEDFESHVIDHFSFVSEGAETMKYIGSEEET